MRHPLRSLVVTLALVALLLPVSLPAQPNPPGRPPVPEATVQVDCDQGDSLADAVATRADVLTVRFRGTCAEELVITRDRLTIEGLDASAVIADDPATPEPTASLLLLGADVVLRDFAITGSNSRGVLARRSSGVLAENLTVTGAGSTGVTVEESSSVHLTDCAVTDNGFAGVTAWSNSSVVVEGRLDASRNLQVGVLLSTGSGLQSEGSGSVIVADDPGFAAVAVQLGASAQAPLVRSARSGIAVFNFGGHWTGNLDIEATGIALYLAEGGYYSGTLDLAGGFGLGLFVADDATAALQGGDVQAPTAAVVTNSVLQASNTSFGGSLIFNFNGQGYFEGSATTGGVVCDPSALVGGSITCPGAASLRMGGSSAAPAVAAPAHGPFEKPE
jgi:hypothetical protein